MTGVQTCALPIWSEKFDLYVMTRYNDVHYILNNPDTFSSAKGNMIIEDPYRFGKTLGASDNPIHSQMKDIVKNAYTKENISRISKLFSKKLSGLLEEQNEINISYIIEETVSWAMAELINAPLYKPFMKNIIIDSQRHNPFSVIESQVENYKVKNEKLIHNYKKITKTTKNKIQSTGPGIYNEYIKNIPDPNMDMKIGRAHV